MICRGFVVAVATALVAGSFAFSPFAPTVVRADDAGQASLEKALETKISADSVLELSEVIQLCQKALKDGLSPESEKLAKQLMSSTHFERGVKFAQAVFANIDDPTAIAQLIRLRQAAIADMEQVLQLREDEAEARYWLGRLLGLEAREAERARRELGKAIEGAEDDELKVKAYIARGRLEGELEERIADFDRAVKLAPGEPDVYRARALFRFDRNEYEAGLADIDLALKLQEDDASGHLLRGMALTAMKKYDDALPAMNRAIELEPDNASAYAQRGRLHLMREDGEAAVADFNKAIAQGRATPALLLLRASAHQVQGDQEKALADVDAVLKIRPNMPEAVRARALLLAGSGKVAEAIGDLEKLAKEGNDTFDSQLQLGLLYLANGQYQEAIESLTAALKQDSENAEVYAARADAFLRLGKHRTSVEDYREALKRDSENTHVLNNLAWLLATSPDDKLRDGAEAVKLAERACKLTDYEEAHILSTLAAGYAEQGDWTNALKWSNEALEKADSEIREQLQEELDSYKAKKPWRERLGPEAEEKKPEDKPKSEE